MNMISVIGSLSMTGFATAREQMVDCQIRPSDVTRYTVIEAMLTVPRENFVPQQYRDVAYSGDHVPLMAGRVVLDPRVTGKLLDALALTSKDMVLDVGAGLGYVAALAGRMAEVVIALEEDETLAAQASQALVALEADNVVLEEGALDAGAESHGPYDAIIIEGGVEMVPEAILAQLKEGGRIAAILMEGAVGQCRIGTKVGERVTWRRAFDATAPVLPGFSKEKSFVF